ncbi:hypothetical protein [Nocardioides sp. URHA0020]|uniref:hypothetical protein n=1 Tax=Nocardioides sp. URHA0020 TaxID=1380392 RepID=UPI00048DA4EB|nr:hypothetical protein [Nocardioides sp. URHA0020]
MSTPEHLGPPPDPVGRSGALLRDRWLLSMLIAFGVMALVVVSVIGFSGAYFSSRSTSPDNAFTAATVELDLARSGSLIDGAGLFPGASEAGTQTVTNGGHRSAVTLGTGDLSASSRLADVLQVVVTQTSPSTRTVYDGRLSNLASVALGTFERGESRSYEIAVRWPADEDDPSLQGADVTFSFDWRAESVA